jgi:hypothetical protein
MFSRQVITSSYYCAWDKGKLLSLIVLTTEYKEKQPWNRIYGRGESTWRKVEKDVRYARFNFN